MDFNIEFNLVRSQKLLLSPHLKQAMDILDMDSQQLSVYVEEQAAANPVLEISFSGALIYEQQALNEEDTPTGTTLMDYLLLQLESMTEGKQDSSIGEYLIDNTDENGYLKISIDEAAVFLKLPVTRIEKVLGLLQTFDPPGICARDLKECLIIQLKQQEIIDYAAFEIVENYLDELASGDISAVVEATGLSEERISDIFSLIKTLEPRPGREYYTDEVVKAITADVLVTKIDNVFVALMNEDAIPVADIGDYYTELDTCDMSEEDRSFIQNRVDNAAWLIKCIEQRKTIIYSVAEIIVKEQQSFFENGYSSLKITSPEYLSNTLNIHESLIGSALKGKYMQCRWGTFEFLFFCK